MIRLSVALARGRRRGRRSQSTRDDVSGSGGSGSGRAVRVALVALVWVLLWRDGSVAVWIAGAGVGLASLLLAPVRRPVRLRPLGVIRLVAVVSWQLIVATLSVVGRALGRGEQVPGFVRVRVPMQDAARLTALVVAVTVTPGTTVVEVDPATGHLLVHALHLEDPAALRAQVTNLATLVRGAFPRETEATS